MFQKRSKNLSDIFFWKNSILWFFFFFKSPIHQVIKRFGCWSQTIFEGPILWVLLWKGFNSSSQFFNQISLKGSILWVTLKNSMLWVIFFKKKHFHPLSQIPEKVQFFATYFKKKFNSLSPKVQFIESCSKEGWSLWVMQKKALKSLSHVKRVQVISEKEGSGFNSLLHIRGKGPTLCSIFEKKRFNSLSKKMLWVKLEKKRFNSLSHGKKGSSSHFSKKV